jgi:glutaredoxin-related protein
MIKDDKFDSKINKEYNCIDCKYKTMLNYDFKKHLLTAKHKRLIENNEKNIKQFICNCGKEYKDRHSLSRHKKSCNYKEKNIPESLCNVSSFFEIIKQNNEFKDLLIQQNKQIQEQFLLINKFIEKEPTNVINNTNNNSTTNQSFNLNVFLNETCKDAMNVKEFLDNLNPTLDDLENVGEKGFVKGISEIILKSLRGMEVNKRPIHCTDIKREIVYLKEDDKWNKDDTNNSKMKELIRKVENKNFCNICEWQNNHPDTRILDSPDYMKQNLLIDKSCEAVNNEDRVRGKVLKELLKEIHVNGK